ncbi:phage tail tape measure protein [Amorphus coralli]|uniref:phage tail tape measure protein n=1 Tax=Amorphus coralli TaxID=340680 RepID=UPI00037B2DB7|nr:phage tail tape measure protein [Amorphus coralli]
MANRSMALDVLVRLRDRMSGPMRRLQGNLRSLVNVGRQIGFIGTAIAAISFLGPIQQAAAFEQQLLDIAGTANLVGDAAFDFARETRRQYEDLALTVGQTSDTIAAGAGQMIAAGVNEGVIDRNLGTIGKAATAASTEFSDMAAVATSLLNILDVPETELEGALAGLVVGGKEGAFELKDMARYFPQLTGQMKKFGIVGREASDQLAAMLQVARMGTSDPAQAATNLQNFLSKALAPVTQKKFQEMGVDIQAVMQDAAAKGINPIEAMLQKIGTLTGVSGDAIGKYMAIAQKRGLEGGEALEFVREQLEAIGAAGKLGELFQDQQVLDFLIPMMANIDEYQRIKAEVAAATGATIDADFDTKMRGLNVQLVRFREIGVQAVRDVGSAFGEWLPGINDQLEAGLRWMRATDEATGGWISKALVAAGGGILLAGALGALGLALPIVGAGFAALGSIVAIALGPLGLIIGLITAGAIHMAKNWDKYGPRIQRAWDRTKRAFVEGGQEILRQGRALAARYEPMIRDRIGRAWDWASERASRAWARMPAMEDLTLPNLRAWFDDIDWSATATDAGKAIADGIIAGWRLRIEGINAAGDMLAWLSDQIDKIDAGALGQSLASMLVNGFKAATDVIGAALSGEAGGIGGALLDAVGNAIKGGGELIESVMRKLFDFHVGFWSTLLGPTIENIKAEFGNIDLMQAGIDAINSLLAGMKQQFVALLDWVRDIPGKIRGAIGSIDLFGGAGGGGGGAGWGAPANENTPAEPSPGGVEGRRLRRRSSLETGRKFAAVPAAKTDVSGTIRIAVDGPGRVTEAASSNRQVAFAPDRGRAVSRA